MQGLRLLRRTLLVAVAAIGGALVAIVPAAAQLEITAHNVTQVIDEAGRRYDRVADYKWVLTDENGLKFNADATTIPPTTVNLSFAAASSPYATVLIQHAAGAWSANATFRGGRAAENKRAASVYGLSEDHPVKTCRDDAAASRKIVAGLKCTCDLSRGLKPLQGAVGMNEVASKTKDIHDDVGLARRDLAYDPIKVVRGPDEILYVTDHHHGGLAWLKDGHTMGTCAFEVLEFEPSRGDLFFKQLIDKDWIRLKDQNGAPLQSWADLPFLLTDLPDDPYRTLAWLVRRSNGFCRANMHGHTEFAEFKWADWMRTRPELPIDKVRAARKKSDQVVADALAVIKTSAPSDLPGYRTEGYANACARVAGDE